MISLRTISDKDLADVLIWRNNESVRKNMYTDHIISEEEHREWYEKASVDPTRRLLICEEAGESLGFVSFYDISPRDNTATWAFFSANPHQRGVGSKMEIAALDYAFFELKLEKLSCEVLSFNHPVISFHRKHGFQIEGIFVGQYVRGTDRFDIFRLAIFRRDWVERLRPVLLGKRTSNIADSEVKVGANYRQNVTFTRKFVNSFSSLSGDSNPVHIDEAYARKCGFDKPIVHGMAVGSILSKIIGVDFPGAGSVYLKQSLDFLSPVFVDDDYEFRLKVLSIVGDRIVIQTRLNEDKLICVDGEAVIRAPR